MYADEVPEKAKKISNVQIVNGVKKKLNVSGNLTIKEKTQIDDLTIKGDLTANLLTVKKLCAAGKVQLTNSAVESTVIKGELDAQETTFNTIRIDSDKISLYNCRVKGDLIVMATSGNQKEVVIHLFGNTVVEGNVILKGDNVKGSVWAGKDITVKGKIQGNLSIENYMTC